MDIRQDVVFAWGLEADFAGIVVDDVKAGGISFL